MAARMALGLDVRNRDFNATALIELIDSLTRDPRVTPEVLYLDCAPDELIRRYSQTRRRHPLAPAETPDRGHRARDRPARADPGARRPRDRHDGDEPARPQGRNRRLVRRRTSLARLPSRFSPSPTSAGVPRGVDMIFDCRFLKNPYWSPALRALDGRDPQVAAHIAEDARFAAFFQKLQDLILFLLPANLAEGKAHLTIGFGCTGGQHRSVAVAEKLGNVLAEAGWPVTLRHRELERRAGGTPGTGTG